MKKEELALELNGRQYRNEVTSDESKECKKHGLVVVFGASDDLLEFRGAIYEELGAWEGTKVWLNEDGTFQTDQFGDPDDMGGVCIEAIWAPEHPDASWLIKTDIPHVTFDIFEDDELYCRGIVFSMEDLKPKNAGSRDSETVSNELHELKYVADKLSVPVWVVMKVKEDLQTNDRSKIEAEVPLAFKAYSDAVKKATKWDELDNEIAKFYPESDIDEDDGGLDIIGEIAARKLGYL